ncbi:hypothetical protein [Guggenheimella bovis]
MDRSDIFIGIVVLLTAIGLASDHEPTMKLLWKDNPPPPEQLKKYIVDNFVFGILILIDGFLGYISFIHYTVWTILILFALYRIYEWFRSRKK